MSTFVRHPANFGVRIPFSGAYQQKQTRADFTYRDLVDPDTGFGHPLCHYPHLKYPQNLLFFGPTCRSTSQVGVCSVRRRALLRHKFS